MPRRVQQQWSSDHGYFNVNAPQGSLPLLVKGTKGGLSACTNDGPGIAPTGLMKVNRVELTGVSGIFGVPSGLSPPRLTAPPFWRLKKLITVSFENPAPSTVSVPP